MRQDSHLSLWTSVLYTEEEEDVDLSSVNDDLISLYKSAHSHLSGLLFQFRSVFRRCEYYEMHQLINT